MAKLIIYTDGGCSGNPGPGGWAYTIDHQGQEIFASGGDAATTNNQMELRAVIEALHRAQSLAQAGDSVEIHTDSQYVKNGITTWIHGWKRNGWRTADKKPVKNQALWEELDSITALVRPQFFWVKGHAGIAGNERCDQLVGLEIKKFTHPQ